MLRLMNKNMFTILHLNFLLILTEMHRMRSDKHKGCNFSLSYDVASESEITPCNKIDKPLVVYRFTENVMTSITTLRP